MNKEDGIYVHGKKVRDLTEKDELAIDYMLLEQEKENLIKYLEEEYRINNEEWKNAKSRDDEMYYFGKLKAISSILEKVRSGKHE